MTIVQTIWQLIILTTFWSVGIKINSDRGDIFYFLEASDRFPTWLYRPIIGCVNCMASLHSIIVGVIYRFVVVDFTSALTWWQLLLTWVLVAVITSGTNAILFTFYKWLGGDE